MCYSIGEGGATLHHWPHRSQKTKDQVTGGLFYEHHQHLWTNRPVVTFFSRPALCFMTKGGGWIKKLLIEKLLDRYPRFIGTARLHLYGTVEKQRRGC